MCTINYNYPTHKFINSPPCGLHQADVASIVDENVRRPKSYVYCIGEWPIYYLGHSPKLTKTYKRTIEGWVGAGKSNLKGLTLSQRPQRPSQPKSVYIHDMYFCTEYRQTDLPFFRFSLFHPSLMEKEYMYVCKNENLRYALVTKCYRQTIPRPREPARQLLFKAVNWIRSNQ